MVPQFFAARLPECDLDVLKARLYDEHRVEVPLIRWNGQPLIRVSFQAYNDEADADALMKALARFCRKWPVSREELIARKEAVRADLARTHRTLERTRAEAESASGLRRRYLQRSAARLEARAVSSCLKNIACGS